jgi:hypothetical protein
MDDDGYERWMDCLGKYLTDNSLALLLCQNHYQTLQSLTKISGHAEILSCISLDKLSGWSNWFHQRWPILFLVFNRANFSRFDGLTLIFWGGIFQTLGINLTSG